MAAQKIESIGQLAGGIAHDFNNILNSIYGFSEISQILLQSDEVNIEKLQQNIETIQHSAEKGSALTHQLHVFNQKQGVQSRVVDLNESMHSMKNILSKLLGDEYKLKLTAQNRPYFIKADPSQIEQIILNFVVNARDAMSEGGTVELHLNTIASDDMLFSLRPELTPQPLIELKAIDQGCGMSEALMEKIFEPFFTTKAEGKGTGLGLATTFEIVKKSGGQIYVESVEGEGSTFFVYFPQTVEQPEIEVALDVCELQGGTETVLLVDDNETFRKITAKLLERLGYTLFQANSGEQALEKFNSIDKTVDLLLSDITMPGMDGISLADKVVEKWPHMKVLLMTGYSERLDGNVHKVLNKPIKIELLAREIRQILNSKEDLKQ